MSVAQLQQRLQSAHKRTSFAWAKYYEATHSDHRDAVIHYRVIRSVVRPESAADTAIPEHIKTALTEMATTLKRKWECPICLDMIDDGHLAISNCGHFYCDGCLDTLKSRARTADPTPNAKWECAVCRRKHKCSDA
jgi:hypothetical protein